MSVLQQCARTATERKKMDKNKDGDEEMMDIGEEKKLEKKEEVKAVETRKCQYILQFYSARSDHILSLIICLLCPSPSFSTCFPFFPSPLSLPSFNNPRFSFPSYWISSLFNLLSLFLFNLLPSSAYRPLFLLLPHPLLLHLSSFSLISLLYSFSPSPPPPSFTFTPSLTLHQFPSSSHPPDLSLPCFSSLLTVPSQALLSPLLPSHGWDR